VGTDGLPVLLKGIVWSGFENETMVKGLQVVCQYSDPFLQVVPHL